MKKIGLATGLFIAYVIIINLLGSYKIVYTKTYGNDGVNGNGFQEIINMGDSVSVEVKRARMMFGLMPTRIFLVGEINVSYLNYVVFILYVGFVVYYVSRKVKMKNDYKIYEELVKTLEKDYND